MLWICGVFCTSADDHGGDCNPSEAGGCCPGGGPRLDDSIDHTWAEEAVDSMMGLLAARFVGLQLSYAFFLAPFIFLKQLSLWFNKADRYMFSSTAQCIWSLWLGSWFSCKNAYNLSIHWIFCNFVVQQSIWIHFSEALTAYGHVDQALDFVLQLCRICRSIEFFLILLLILYSSLGGAFSWGVLLPAMVRPARWDEASAG